MSHKKHRKSNFIYRIEYVFFRIGTGIIRLLPLSAAYALARLLAGGVRIFDRKHYTRTVQHIRHSGILSDPAEIRKLAHANLVHIVKVFIEIVKFDQIINEDNFYEHLSVADDEWSQKMMNPDTTCQIILATAHIGNWELAGGCHSKYCGIPMLSIGRPLENPYIAAYFFKKRCSFQHETFPKEKGLRPFLTGFKNGQNLTIVADQHCATSEGVEVRFFGHPARAHATPALLHLRTRLPIAMPFLARKDDHFNFQFHCQKPIMYEPTGDKEADIKAIVQLYTTQIENAVREFPEQWLWAHRRWLDCNRHETIEHPVEQGKN